MLDFSVDNNRCTKCGLCAADCPARIINLAAGYPQIEPAVEESCYHCQHCLAICPVGAVSIFGLRPENSRSLAGNLPDALQMETLIKGRRSVRQYKPENLEPELIERLLAVAGHAPSGMNTRQIRFTVVDDRQTLAGLHDAMMSELSRKIRDNASGVVDYFVNYVRQWEEDRIDFLFRGAPHLLIVSAPQCSVSPLPDCLIALTYFELYAQSLGLGTVWDGLARYAINDLLPHFRSRFGIPDDHLMGNAMAFGRPAIQYARTVQYGMPDVHRVA